MSETLSEAAGCALLARLFRERGYTIRRNVPFRDYGVSFDIDGWDATARVGFEFLSSEKDDHDDLTLEEFEKLKDAERRGELFLFIIDEVEPLSAAVLREAAGSFLDDVARARSQRRRSTTKRPAGPAKQQARGAKTARPRAAAAKKPGKATGSRAVKTGTRATGGAKPSAGKRPRKRAKTTGTRRR